jgi:outer membrane protein TolC
MRTPCLLLIVLAAPAQSAICQAPAITLEEAIRRAERVQPTVVRAEADVRTANARKRSALGSYFPAVSASSQASDFFAEGEPRIDPVTGQLTRANTSNRSLSATISGSVDLFTGFRRRAESRAAGADKAAAEASLVDARFAQALATTNQFLDALSAAQLLRVREASVRRAEEQLNVSVAKLRTGSATRSDSLRSFVTLGSVQLDQIRTEADLASAEANLARLIGESGRVRALDDSAFYRILPPLDTAALRAEAESKSPRIQSAAATASAARASASAARSEYWPSLTLAGNTGWYGSQSNDYTLLNQRQLSLGLRWNLFDGFSRELAVAQREADVDLAEANAGDAKRGIAAELTTRLAQLEAARTGITIAQASVAAANEDLRVQQQRYRLGVSTIVDLLTSQEALDQAEVDAVDARFAYLRARAEIEALIGRKL